MNKICCVEDDSAILTALQYTLSQEGYEVMTAMTKTQGLELTNRRALIWCAGRDCAGWQPL